MVKFPLLSDLQVGKEMPRSNIKYQRYTIPCVNEKIIVGIPLRECVSFEQTLDEVSDITKYQLRDILRKHRGVIVNNET